MPNPQTLLNEGMRLMQANQPQQALPLFNKLCALGINDSRLFRVMGVAYERLHQWQNARQSFQRSLSIQPQQPDLLESVARIENRFSNFEAGIACYRKALALSNSVTSKLHLALTLLKTTPPHLPEAKILFSELQDAERVDPRVFVGLARIAAFEKQSDTQKEWLNKALHAAPDLTMAVSDLAWWYQERGQFKDAMVQFQKLDSLAPDNPDTIENLAISCLDAGELSKAIEVVKGGLSRLPSNTTLAGLYASIKYELNEPDFLSPYQQIPLDKMPLTMLEDYLNKLVLDGQLNTADEVLSSAEKFHEGQLQLDLMKANLLYRQDRFEAALHLLKSKFSSPSGASENWLSKMALNYLALGEGKRALKYLDVLLKRFPFEQYYWSLKSLAYRILEDAQYEWLCRYDDFVFTSPIDVPAQYSDIASLNSELLATLQNWHNMKRNPLAQSLSRGTQTTGTLFNRDNPHIDALQAALASTIKRLLLTLPDDPSHPLLQRRTEDIHFTASWSVQLESEGFHKPHVHPKGWYSSVYYVDVPDSVSCESDKSGWLNLGKPGVKLPTELQAEKWVKPVAGNLTIFPSYMWHGTEPFKAPVKRTTVAFDFVPGS